MIGKSLFFLLFLLPSICRAQGANPENLSQLITDARTLALDAGSTTRQRFSNSTITEFINMGQRQLVSQGECIQQSLIFQLQLGVTYYSLPSNYEYVVRVTVGSKYIPQLTPASLDGRSRGWESASGYPTYYFIDFSSRGLVGFAPWPQQSTDTDTVKIEYSVAANDLVNNTDLPFNGISELQQYDHGLAYYAAGMMSGINNQTQQAQGYMALYQAVATTFMKECVNRQYYLPSGVGSP